MFSINFCCFEFYYAYTSLKYNLTEYLYIRTNVLYGIRTVNSYGGFECHPGQIRFSHFTLFRMGCKKLFCKTNTCIKLLKCTLWITFQYYALAQTRATSSGVSRTMNWYSSIPESPHFRRHSICCTRSIL